MAVIEQLHLEVNAQTVYRALLEHGKLKLKQKHVSVSSKDTLLVVPPEMERGVLFYRMQALKHSLRSIIINVRPRAVCLAVDSVAVGPVAFGSVSR